MSETKMSDIIRASLEGIKDFTERESVISRVINTPSGVTVIPISRVNIGFATGGLDYGTKRISTLQNFGGGGGTALSITPIAFLTVDQNGETELVRLDEGYDDVGRITSLVEKSPEIVKRIKDALT